MMTDGMDNIPLAKEGYEGYTTGGTLLVAGVC